MQFHEWSNPAGRADVAGRCIGGELHGRYWPFGGRRHGDVVQMLLPQPIPIEPELPASSTVAVVRYRLCVLRGFSNAFGVWVPDWVDPSAELHFVLAMALRGGGDGT